MEKFSTYYDRQINEGFMSKVLGTTALVGSLLGTPNINAQQPTPTSISNTNINLNRIADYIKKSEGYKESAYRDSKGYLTIGIGHKLVPSDKVLFNELFSGSIDYNKINNGTSKLNKSQILKLFSYDLNKRLKIAKQKYPKFTSFPEQTQAALLDSIFRGERHPRTDQLINSGKWLEASKEYLNDKEYKEAVEKKSGVARRMERNARIIAATK